MFGDNRRHFAADASGLVVLVDNQHLAGLAGGGNDGSAVQRLQGAQIKDMRGNAFLALQLLRRLHRKMQRQTVPDHRNIAAFPQQVRFTDRNRVIPFRNIFLD
ncbi:hypothetical protein D3C73_833750 [compost metagenome]